ncbi:alpha/beta fold hydrolase [Breznakiella homolactica]|uniref:Alpha/beta fold hydrolase n=1 Tax=Breznakiella homolactica TaxID=2798577 RepID=A0A7T7XRB8_9SPIR|nr:alpha/beta fold hydrolase [Breznakiella homolactica]QQO11069.1 alpha/beta fold hydrolase [Breznakiella homolactica]
MKPWPDLERYARSVELSSGGDTLFLYDTGSGPAGAPAVVMVHGLGDEADSWRHIIPLVAPWHRVIALDLPGFGRSKIRGPSTLKKHAAAVRTAAGLFEGPGVLAGSSMGAVIAETAAFADPVKFPGTVLFDGCFPASSGLPAGLGLMALPALGKKWYRAFRSDPDAAYRSLEPYYRDLSALPEADRTFLRERVMDRVESRLQERGYFSSLRSLIGTYLFSGPRYGKFAASYPGKMLLLWGEDDRVMPRDASGKLREIRPDAGFELIPNAGHLPQQDNPAAAAEKILGFIRRL